MSWWMGPLSYLYQGVTDVKNDLFARHKIAAHRVPVPVLSIGNLTMGGTGKTPFVDYTLQYFLQKNKKVGVISRAYKAQAQNPVRVNPAAKKAAQIFGDEPLWLARKHPSVAVFVGQTKWQIAKWAMTQEKLDLLILDDGFQHRRLHRDLDIVLLDATEKSSNYRTVPQGRAREKFAHIQRAQLVVISKCNWVTEEKLSEVRALVPPGLAVVETGSRISRLRNFHSGELRAATAFKHKTALLFSAIARPDVFVRVAGEGFARSENLPFPDHHLYQADDIESLLQKKAKFELDFCCCTEKDAVKLEAVWPADQELWVSELELNVLKNEEKLHEVFDQFCP